MINFDMAESMKLDTRKKKAIAMIVKRKLMDVWELVNLLTNSIEDHAFCVKIDAVLRDVEVALDDVMLDESYYNEQIARIKTECEKRKNNVLEYIKTRESVKIGLSGDKVYPELIFNISRDTGMNIDEVAWCYKDLIRESKIKEENGIVIINETEVVNGTSGTAN